MPSRIEAFEQHNIHATAKSLKIRLDALQSDSEADSAFLLYWNRSLQVFELMVSTLDGTDPALVPRGVLDELASSSTRLEQHLSSYVTTEPRSPALLDNVEQEIDSILISLAKLRIPADVQGVEGIASAVTTLRRSVAQLVNNIDAQVDELQERLNLLITHAGERQAEFEAQHSQFDTALRQFQEQDSGARQTAATEFQEAQEDRRKQFQEMQEDRRAQFTDELTNQRARFKTSLEKRESLFDALIEESESKQSTTLADGQTMFANTERRLTDTAQSILQQLEEYKRQAEELVHTTAMTGMAGGYKRVADVHLWTARFWQLVAILAMIALSYFLYILIQLTFAVEFSLFRFASRVFVASSIGVVAAYAAKQADRHQENERFNRQQELELASLSLYLAGMPEVEQHKARLQLIERLFGQAQPVSPIKEAIEASGGSVFELAKLLVETVGKMR